MYRAECQPFIWKSRLYPHSHLMTGMEDVG
jgi:hypothetical protein